MITDPVPLLENKACAATPGGGRGLSTAGTTGATRSASLSALGPSSSASTATATSAMHERVNALAVAAARGFLRAIALGTKRWASR
jgi:hypothetical protein